MIKGHKVRFSLNLQDKCNDFYIQSLEILELKKVSQDSKQQFLGILQSHQAIQAFNDKQPCYEK